MASQNQGQSGGAVRGKAPAAAKTGASMAGGGVGYRGAEKAAPSGGASSSGSTASDPGTWDAVMQWIGVNPELVGVLVFAGLMIAFFAAPKYLE